MGLFDSIFGSSQTTTGTHSDTSSQSQQQQSQFANEQNQTGTYTPTENPYFTAFRQSLLPALAKQYADAQKPVYGQNEIAGNINQTNNVYKNAMDSAMSGAARRGALQSGSMNSAANSLDVNRAGQISNFNSQLPFLNSQNAFNRTQNLLGLAGSFLGSSPIGSTTSGNATASGNASSQMQGQASNSGTSQQKTTSNPGLMGAIGQLASVALPFVAPGLGSLMGGGGNGEQIGGGIGSGGVATQPSFDPWGPVNL